MPTTLEAIDISNSPELGQLVDQLRATGAARMLRRGGEDVAVLTPIAAAAEYPWRQPTAEDDEAFRAAAGSWTGTIDAERFLAANDDSRRRSSRPPVAR